MTDFSLLTTLLPFLLTCIVIESTPGPNMAYLAILSITNGRSAGFAATVGVTLGLLIVGLVAALGLAALLSNSPPTYQILRIGGVLYLLWLAWDGWKQKPISSEYAYSLTQKAKFFRRGLITNLLNPKAAVFYVTILPEFVTLDWPISVSSQTMTLTVLYVTVATIIHISIVSTAGTARQFLENEHKRLIVQRMLSLALVGIAFWFAWGTRS